MSNKVNGKLVVKIAWELVDLVEDVLNRKTLKPPDNYIRLHAEAIKQVVLSDPHIIEYDPDAELPKGHFYKSWQQTIYATAQHDMLKAGWVKPK